MGNFPSPKKYDVAVIRRVTPDEIPRKLIHIDAGAREKIPNSSHTKKASEIDVKYNYD